MKQKHCPRCGETKPTDQFGTDRGRPDGLKPWCKTCRKIEGAKDFQKHKKKRLAKHKVWIKNNPEKQSQYSRTWNERHPEERKAIVNANNARRDPIEHATRSRNDYHKDPVKYNVRSHTYHAANKESVAATVKTYRERNPILISALKRNYKARKRGASGTHTAEDIQAILTKQDWTCIYCPAALIEGYHVDHVTPLSRGGSNWPVNLQCLCGPCNLRKKDKTHEEFVALLAKY